MYSFIETDFHTLSPSQQLAPEITADTTSLNTTTEISSTVPTDTQTLIAANHLNDTSININIYHHLNDISTKWYFYPKAYAKNRSLIISTKELRRL